MLRLDSRDQDNLDMCVEHTGLIVGRMNKMELPKNKIKTREDTCEVNRNLEDAGIRNYILELAPWRRLGGSNHAPFLNLLYGTPHLKEA